MVPCWGLCLVFLCFCVVARFGSGCVNVVFLAIVWCVMSCSIARDFCSGWCLVRWCLKYCVGEMWLSCSLCFFPHIFDMHHVHFGSYFIGKIFKQTINGQQNTIIMGRPITTRPKRDKTTQTRKTCTINFIFVCHKPRPRTGAILDPTHWRTSRQFRGPNRNVGKFKVVSINNLDISLRNSCDVIWSK